MGLPEANVKENMGVTLTLFSCAADRFQPNYQTITMKFVISYAYDRPHYVDFLVEAKNQREALKKAKESLISGRLKGMIAQSDDSTCNHRVFVLRAADKYGESIDSFLP